MASADDSSKGYDDREWKAIEDREERRRVQNRNAQRRHRDRRRLEDQEKQQIATHQHAAGSSYTPTRFEEVNSPNPEGLPWGAFALTTQDALKSNTSSTFPSPMMASKDRKASYDSTLDDYRGLSAREVERLQVPRLSRRGLAISTSVPQLRDVAMTQATQQDVGLHRSKSQSTATLKRKQEDG